jgi:hypothetical protein
MRSAECEAGAVVLALVPRLIMASAHLQKRMETTLNLPPLESQRDPVSKPRVAPTKEELPWDEQNR